MKRFFGLFLVFGLLLSIFSAAASAAETASFNENSYYHLLNVNSGKYLEVENAVTENGGNVRQWENTNCQCQEWRINQNSDGFYEIVNRNSGKALDVYARSTENGGNIVQWDRNGGSNQQWRLVQSGSSYKLVSRHSGKAVEVYEHSQANGGNVVQWDDLGNPNQLWNIVPTNSGSDDFPGDFTRPVGFAAMNGGTTGGQGGRIVYASTGAELQQYIDDRSRSSNPDEPLIIYVTGTITVGNSSNDRIEVKNHRGQAHEIRNISIIGVGTSGEFNGIGLRLINAQNVIVQNLSIHHVRAGVGEGTAIEVTQNSRNVWIDHNEFYSQYDGNNNPDYYDGLVDIKRGSQYVTVSWNKFSDHWKTMLVGHTDDASLAPNYITYHHNYFYNLNSRVPLIRFADVHMFNNYFKDIHDTAINSRMGARVFVENNYFENVGSGQTDPTTGQIKSAVGWFYGSSQTGYWNLRGNTFINTPSSHLSSTTNYVPPYSYQVQSAADAKAAVERYSGVGIVPN
ncbi:Pectate lyase [Evansella caseinilytica]|uniref:Pectate lyase n=1 Tax=Evansella caseinilytica TaxID=1503961 RepID=A0A1H3IEL8_9BACI|nr:RICIN domain-containing protein [Evansella caseinilytica]SDY26303.1 Pectate lyase [Evansella caseinilytica]